MARERRKKLKPAGHSATIEAMIQPAIVIGSTLMSGVAAYVLGADSIKAVFNGTASGFDFFLVALSAGIGFLIDMSIIVSATRYKMHSMRGQADAKWRKLSLAVLMLGLGTETMTLLYFFYEMGASLFPASWAGFFQLEHSVLAISRAFMPPTILAYFVAGVMPIVIERSDRNREIKSRSSQDIAVLVDRLTEIEDTEDAGEMIAGLGALLTLNAYASNDSADDLNEADQNARDGVLLQRLAELHGVAVRGPQIAAAGRKQRTPEEMDALRLRMLTEGKYPLDGLSRDESRMVRRSLVDGTRRNQLCELAEMSEGAVVDRLRQMFPDDVVVPA